MARTFLTHLNLNKNELQNATVQNLAAAPSSPVKGQIYFDSTGNILYWWSGTVWVAAMDAGGSGFPGYATSVVAETTFSQVSAVGVATTVARADHTHGSPVHDAAAHSTIPISALAPATGPINMGGNVINNVGTPVSGTDAANKSYVDNLSAGLSWKDAVRVCSAGFNFGTMTGLLAVDGVTVAAGDRVLLKDQSTASTNGIYVAAVGAWTRAPDFDAAGEADGAAVFVMEGATMADTAWVCTTNAPITIGTTPLAWSQFAGGGTIVGGAGLLLSGNTLNILSDSTIVVTADQISRGILNGDVTSPAGANATTIAPGVVTNAKLADMAPNSVKANFAGIANPPSDVSMAAFSSAIGAMRRFTVTSAAGVTTVANHAFNNRNVITSVYRGVAPFDVVDCDIENTDLNNVTVRFATAVGAGDFYIVVIG